MQIHTQFLFAALICLCLFTEAIRSQQCHGDGWGPTEGKCIKVFGEQMSMEEGQELCAAEYTPDVDIMVPRLLEISSEIDQALIEGFLRKSPLAPGFWLGATRTGDSSNFTWSRNDELEFTNWAPNHPSNVPERKCVELQSEAGKKDDTSSQLGLWKDVLCTKGNWVICERIPGMSMLEIVLAIRALNKQINKMNGTTMDEFENVLTYLNSSLDKLEAIHEADVTLLSTEIANNTNQHNQLNTKVNTIDASVVSLNTNMNTAKADIVTLRNDIPKQVPVGFVYFQLPSTSEPRVIWPQYTWVEISSSYAGAFFRVVGGSAAAFGTLQQDAFQGHLHSNVITGGPRSGTDNTNDKSQVDYLTGGNSGNAVSNGGNGSPRTASETRPLNYAIKIWRRSA